MSRPSPSFMVRNVGGTRGRIGCAPVGDDRGDWGPLLDDLEARQRAAREMGGAERVERQHAKGKLTARERVERLFDPGTFVELGALVGTSPRAGVDTIPADGFVAGMGRIDGRAGARRLRGLHRARRLDRRGRDRQARAPRASSRARNASPSCSCSTAPATGSRTAMPAASPTTSRRSPRSPGSCRSSPSCSARPRVTARCADRSPTSA